MPNHAEVAYKVWIIHPKDTIIKRLMLACLLNLWVLSPEGGVITPLPIPLLVTPHIPNLEQPESRNLFEVHKSVTVKGHEAIITNFLSPLAFCTGERAAPPSSVALFNFVPERASFDVFLSENECVRKWCVSENECVRTYLMVLFLPLPRSAIPT